MEKQKKKVKDCSKCGASFDCSVGLPGSCWCNSVPLPEAVLVQLKKDYDNCLCPDCLETYAS